MKLENHNFKKKNGILICNISGFDLIRSSQLQVKFSVTAWDSFAEN